MYIYYHYFLRYEDNDYFLFGVLLKNEQKVHSFNSNTPIKISEKYQFEIWVQFCVVEEKQYEKFFQKYTNDQIVNWEDFGIQFESKPVLFELQMILNEELFEKSPIYYHQIQNIVLQDFSAVPLSSFLPQIKEFVTEYIALFFQKNSTQEFPNIPLGSLYLCPNSYFCENPIKLPNKIEPNTPFYFSLTDCIDTHQIHVVLKTTSLQIAYDKIELVDFNKTKGDYNIQVSEPVSYYKFTVYNKFGVRVYTFKGTILRSLSMDMTSSINFAYINDALTVKNPELGVIRTKPETTKITPDFDYNKYQKIQQPIIDFWYNSDIVQESHYQKWFESITDAIPEIKKLVEEGDESIFIDPYFEAPPDNANSEKQANIEINQFVVLHRLSGKIKILTDSKHAEHIKSILENYKSFHMHILVEVRNINKSDKDVNGFHDRYLLVKKGSSNKLFSLSNSLSAFMQDHALLISEVYGDAKEKILQDIEGKVESSNLIFPQEVQNTPSKPKEKTYVESLLKDVDENNIKDHIETIKQNFESAEDKDTALLGMCEILNKLILLVKDEIYFEFKDFVKKKIAEYPAPTELLCNLEEYLIKEGYCAKVTKSSIHLSIPDDYTIQSYINIKMIERFGTETYAITNIYEWETLLKILININPDSIIAWFKRSQRLELQDVFFNILHTCGIDSTIALGSNSPMIKTLGIQRYFDQYLKDKTIKESQKNIYDLSIKYDVPTDDLIIFLLYEHYSFMDQNHKIQPMYLETILYLFGKISKLQYLDLNKKIEILSKELNDNGKSYLFSLLVALKNKLSNWHEYDNLILGLLQNWLQTYDKDNKWTSLVNSVEYFLSIDKAIKSLSEESVIKFLKKSYKKYNLLEEMSLITIPYFSELTQRSSEIETMTKAQIFTYIYQQYTTTEDLKCKIFMQICDLIQKGLLTELQWYQANGMFILLYAFFDMLNKNPTWESTETLQHIKKVLCSISKHNKLAVFSQLYNKTNPTTDEIQSLGTFIKDSAIRDSLLYYTVCILKKLGEKSDSSITEKIIAEISPIKEVGHG